MEHKREGHKHYVAVCSRLGVCSLHSHFEKQIPSISGRGHKQESISGRGHKREGHKDYVAVCNRLGACSLRSHFEKKSLEQKREGA